MKCTAGVGSGTPRLARLGRVAGLQLSKVSSKQITVRSASQRCNCLRINAIAAPLEAPEASKSLETKDSAFVDLVRVAAYNCLFWTTDIVLALRVTLLPLVCTRVSHATSPERPALLHGHFKDISIEIVLAEQFWSLGIDLLRYLARC